MKENKNLSITEISKITGRAPNGFRLVPKHVKKPGFGGSGSGNPGNGSGNGSGNPGSNSNQCQNPDYFSNGPKSENEVINAYHDFMSKMKKKGYLSNISQDRFLKLSVNPQTGTFDGKSVFETTGCLELEVNGTLTNVRRPGNRKVDLDFVAELSGKSIFVDHKGMIDFESLSDQGRDVSTFPSHESVAFNMGNNSVKQKRRYIGLDQVPASMGEVVHLYNFAKIRNRSETPLLMQAVLKGAEKAGYTEGIIFLNHE